MKHSVSSNVWWVNQGSTLKYELENSLIWAPLKGKNEQSQYHWETLKELQRGDIVLNYAQGAISYVSVVILSSIITYNLLRFYSRNLRWQFYSNGLFLTVKSRAFFNAKATVRYRQMMETIIICK